MKKNKKNHPHVGWPLTIFILSVIIALLGLIKTEASMTFLLLSIFLINAAMFIQKI
jgi:hypothetical protein